jgi:hypothetical protein
MVDELTIPAPTRVHKGMAWTSLVLGILGVLLLGLFGIVAIAGIVVAVFALRNARRSPQLYGGTSLAKAGIVLSSFSLLLTLLSPLIVIFLIQPVKFEGYSMMPTLNDGDRIFLGKQIERIDRGDIVVFWFPDDP